MGNFPQRVMIIDDSATMRKIIQGSLKSVGNVATVVCGDYYQAATAADQFKPHLILLDLIMPGKDGPETLKMMRGMAALKEVPIIFVTSAKRMRMIEIYKKLGVIGIIHKPFSSGEFIDSIGGMWSEYQSSLA